MLLVVSFWPAYKIMNITWICLNVTSYSPVLLNRRNETIKANNTITQLNSWTEEWKIYWTNIIKHTYLIINSRNFSCVIVFFYFIFSMKKMFVYASIVYIFVLCVCIFCFTLIAHSGFFAFLSLAPEVHWKTEMKKILFWML